MIVEILGVEKYMDEHLNSTNYLLRLIKYKTPQSSETEIGLSAHTDKKILTILYQNQANGLQVLIKDGQWKNINPTPGTITIMIGDSLHAWTNGRIHLPYHRVLMRENETRYSVALFSTPKDGFTIKAPEELVDEDHPLLFKPYNHLEFLTFSYTEEDLQCESALKTYCGV
uniref:2-oxoglutarate-dependent dioxygenase n=2 Tax=Solanum tuberosum TaxID=4113 RepID=M1DF76_SOLTU